MPSVNLPKIFLLAFFIALLSTQGIFAAEHKDFSFVSMADPQPFRVDLDKSRDEPEWKDRAPRIFSSLMQLDALPARKARGLKVAYAIVNGDMTEFGRRGQREAYDVYLGRGDSAAAVLKTYIGLGNHDYENNVFQKSALRKFCAEAPEGYGIAACAMHSLEWVYAKIRNYALKNKSIDYSEDKVFRGKGSLAYSWDEGDVHFVQLHNYPGYEVRLTADKAGRQVLAEITSSYAWLKTDLAAARARGLKRIILNYHQPGKSFDNRLKDLAKEYNIVAIFTGHSHAFGKRPLWHDAQDGSRAVPIFVAGAFFLGDYYLVDVMRHEIVVTEYNGISGQPVRGVNSHRISTP